MATLAKRVPSNLSSLRVRSDWIELAGRFGFVTRGVIYGLIGVLTVNAARIGRSSSADTRNVISEIGDQPFGEILLGIVALGLLGYAVFKFVLAIRNPEGLGSDAKGKFKRAGYAVVGMIHLFLAYFTARLAFGEGSASRGSQDEAQNSSTILSLPGGELILGAIAAIFIIVAFSHFKRAYNKDFMKHFSGADVDAKKKKWIERVGTFGLAARGVTFAIIGWFLLKASIDSNSREVIGVRGAFSELAQQPYGTVLLIVVALGFVAFGVYSVTRGIYGRLRVGQSNPSY